MFIKRAFSFSGGILLAVILSLSACTGTTPNLGVESGPSPESHVVVFHFNDLHGHIDRLARMATIVRDEREKGSEVYLFCAGDNFSGNPIVDQAEPKGEPVLELLNAIEVDVMVLGNHEFDYGQATLKNFLRRLRFPVLCANIEIPADRWPKLTPYVRFGKEGRTPMTVLGLIQIEDESRIPSTHPSRVEGIDFQDPLEIGARFNDLAREKGIFIALSHLGYSTDRQLAERMPGLDLIVGGHSHTVLASGKTHNGVLITQAGAHGDFLGRVDLWVRNGKVVSKKATLIDLKKVPEAADIAAKVKRHENNPVMRRVVARLENKIDGKTMLGNWICDILRHRLDLDVAFQNSGGVRIQRLEGEIRLKDVYQMLPFGNYIIRMGMYPREIRELLRYDIGLHGEVDLLVSGLKIHVVRTPEGIVTGIDLSNREGALDESRPYVVGFSSYIASAYRFTHTDPGRSLAVTMAETVLAHLESGDPIFPEELSVRVEKEILDRNGNQILARGEVALETGRNPYSGSSSAGNLVADAMRELSGGRIALYPSRLLIPGVRIAKGRLIGGKEIRSLYKFIDRNRIRIVELSGKELANFLLERARYRKGADLQVSGLKWTIDVAGDGTVKGIECRTMPGEERIEETGKYRVALNDYDLEKYYHLDGVDVEKPKQDVTVEGALLIYLQRHSRIDQSVSGLRVKVNREEKGR